MRGEKQGMDECMLATVSDLVGQPLDKMRQEALAFAGGRTWQEVAHASSGDINTAYWQAVFYLCDKYDTTKKLAHTIVKASSIDPLWAARCEAKMLDPMIESLPAKGKGVMVLARVAPFARFGHVVPWEDGLVYDTNCEVTVVPQTLQTVRMRYWIMLGFQVNGIGQL